MDHGGEEIPLRRRDGTSRVLRAGRSAHLARRRAALGDPSLSHDGSSADRSAGCVQVPLDRREASRPNEVAERDNGHPPLALDRWVSRARAESRWLQVNRDREPAASGRGDAHSLGRIPRIDPIRSRPVELSGAGGEFRQRRSRDRHSSFATRLPPLLH